MEVAEMTLRPTIPIDLDQLEARILGRQAGMHWYTLIIEPISWERVAERAGEMGYATYCPMGRIPSMIERHPLTNGINPRPLTDGRHPLKRTIRGEPISRPLMPGYLFVDMPEGRRRFDLFTPSNDPGDRPEELPQGDLRGYVADCARPVVEPVLGCRGLICIDGSPVALHEAVISDLRAREAAGEFDETGTPENGKGFVAKWVKVGAWVDILKGPFASFTGVIEEVTSATLIKVGVHIFGSVTPVGMPPSYVRLARSEDHGILISRKKRSMSQSSVPRNGTATRKSSTALGA
jgi:transcription antitermination factor NusG